MTISRFNLHLKDISLPSPPALRREKRFYLGPLGVEGLGVRLLWLLFALLTLTAQAQVKPDTITINFQLSSKARGETATVVYPDFMTFDTYALHPATDGEGRWSVKIPAYRPLHIQLWDDNKIQGVVWGVLNLYCRPGTEADILLDDVGDRCVFTGENAEVHNAQIACPVKMENFHGHMFDMPMQRVAQTIRSIHERNLHRIDTLRTAHPDLPRGYIEMLYALAEYGFGMDMTQNVFGHFTEQIEGILSQGLTTLPGEMCDLLSEAETRELLHPQGMIPADATTYFRDVINLEMMKQKGFAGVEVDDEGDIGLEILTRVYPITLIDSLDVSDEVRELMKTFYYLDKCGDGMMTALRKAFLRRALNAHSFERLMGYLEHKTEQFAAPTEEEITAIAEAPLDSLTDGQEIFRKLVQPYRGRVVYIDVWGTWCGPCREEMEHLPALHEALADLPVTYIYLANNSPEELWRKSAAHYGLNHADCVNLRLPGSQQQAVENHLNVHGYPTYILVAPDGTIARSGAPRPSQPALVRQAVLRALGRE